MKTKVLTTMRQTTNGRAARNHSNGTHGRRAAGVDREIKQSNLKRLRRIEGQVRGLAKMVEAERYCAYILVQISSVQEALRAVGRNLMRNHLRHCATQAIRSGRAAQAEATYDELLDLIYRYSR